MLNEELQKQDTLPIEYQAIFFGQVMKALHHIMEGQGQPKPERMKVHPRLYEQIVPFEYRITGQPIRCFTVPMEPEIGVTYGTFVFESTESGIIRGH